MLKFRTTMNDQVSIKRLAALLPVAFALTMGMSQALAYEADVHYGLTRWLALEAGYSAAQADSIALGDQRIDGGLVETLRLNLEYACAGRFQQVARQSQHEHYPSATPVPAPAAARVVRPGDAAARVDLVNLSVHSKGKENAMLGKLGEALHPLQDSWSHQGTSSPLMPGLSVECDDLLASGHPALRGGAESHAADITSKWPEDAVAMAQATYEQLIRYGPVEGQSRRPAVWASLVDPVRAFAQANTKADKQAWFVGQGMSDTRFLKGISLPDGAVAGPQSWHWRMLPPAPGEASMQHDASADVRAFFDRFLARWLGGEPVDRVVSDMGPGPARQELIARLKLWKQRDHGRVAELAHAPGRLTATQLKAVDRLVRDPTSSIPPSSVTDAFLPLQPSTPEPVPMLSYVVRSLPDVAGRQRRVALGRLEQAPYDSVGWVVERQADRWVLIGMISTVDP